MERDRRLAEKQEQNKSLFSLLNKAEPENCAGDVVEAIRNAAEGKKAMTREDWEKLFKAVDKIDPGFRDSLTEHMGKFSNREMQFCYLLHIGLKNPQIQHLTNMPRATIWRWAKKYHRASDNALPSTPLPGQ